MTKPEFFPEAMAFLQKIDSILITSLLKSITRVMEDIERFSSYMASQERQSYQPTKAEPRDKKATLVKSSLTRQLGYYYLSIRDWDTDQQTELNNDRLKTFDPDSIRKAINWTIWVTDKQIKIITKLF
jgi:hypothetical protein